MTNLKKKTLLEQAKALIHPPHSVIRLTTHSDRSENNGIIELPFVLAKHAGIMHCVTLHSAECATKLTTCLI